MTYKVSEIFEKAKKAIEENNLFFIEDVVAFIPCSKFYFYDAFPVDSNDYNTLKDMLEQNKIKTKTELREKFFNSERSAEMLALYKLIATKDERRALSMSYTDVTTDDKPLNDFTFKVVHVNESKDGD